MHAYRRDGTAVHYQQTKPGAKHPTRPTSLKDIRDQRLLPSVTEFTKMLSAPGLEEYKVYQTIQACYLNPPFPTRSCKPIVAESLSWPGKMRQMRRTSER